MYNGHNGPTTWQFNQFIEIFNPTDHNINVTGWTIENNDGVKWMFVQGKHADELGDSDILLIWPDRNDDQANDTYMDPDDNYSPWWQWWNNVDKMETWYEGDDFRWWVDVKGNTPPPSYSKQYELHNLTPTAGEFLLDSAGDYVILRNQTGGIVDVVCWGSGYSQLPADAKAIVGDQNAGSNHGIGANESLERIWQDHYPVADFLYGPGVYHLPTPGKIMGEVPDEIEEERSDSWENAAGTSTRGDCGLGLIIQSTSENSSHIQVNKWLYNPKDHLTSGNLTLKGVTFWRLIANVSINPLIVTVCYGDLSSVDESTLKMYAWDHEANVWVEITTSRDEANNRITGQTTLNSSISETVWIGVFGESTGGLGEIPGFNIAFILLGLIGIIIIALKWKVKELKI
ncbi:MAG: lamin tail domain-containing protein [Candidatus Helarchaeota archaeon]